MAEEDEITDNWEDLEDSGELDKRLEKIERPSQKSKSKDRNEKSMAVVVPDNQHSYQPQVRILKREPANSEQDELAARQNASNRPGKTLQEREAAYAEARLRILGSATAKSEDAVASGLSLAASGDTRPERIIEQFNEMKTTENVVRLPKGPDGTKGFHERSTD